MIQTIKRSSFLLSRQCGLTSRVAQSAWRRRRLLILCYHGVALSDEEQWNGQLYVTAAHLEQRLAHLQHTGCAVLPLTDAIDRLYRGDLPERAVVITFDDGYYDFMARAWPVLRAFRYPATVYLTTARVAHNSPVPNPFLSYLLWKARNGSFDSRGIMNLTQVYPLAEVAQRGRAVRDIDASVQTHCRYLTDKDDVARLIASRLGLDYEALVAQRVLTLMRPEEIAALSRDGVDFQLHTHLHRTPEHAGAFVKDVIQNREAITAITGQHPSHLCYPSGAYRMSYLPGLRRAGIMSATTCDPGIAGSGMDRLLLPRFVDTGAVGPLEFEAWVSGVASWLPHRLARDVIH